MKRYLESIDELEKIEVDDIAINLNRFKLINMSDISEDYVFYTGKFLGSTREKYLAKEYALKLLEKGNGIYCNGVIYYKTTLQTDVFNIGISDLKIYISKIRKIRESNTYGFEDYLIDSKDYPLVINYISMYNKGMRDIKWIESRLVDKVSDVDEVISILFNEKHLLEKSAV